MSRPANSRQAKKVVFLSKGEKASSTRYRALQFIPLLTSHGYAVEHATLSGGAGVAFGRALFAAARADIVVVVRKTFPPLQLRLLRTVARRLVFDFDDAIFCNTDGSASATRMRRFMATVKVCDHVFAGNAFLATNAARFNAGVTLLPTCLATERYLVDPPKPADSIDLVWIGSSSTRKYLIDLLPALRCAARRVPGLRLKVIADFDLPDAGLPVVAVRWREDSEARELASAHIGIAPMVDDEWTRGKCALKVLQYMAAGLPVISSPVGVNAEVIEPGVCGNFASNDAEWSDRIVELAADADLRRNMGEAGRRRVAFYSRAAVAARMRSAFDQLLRT